MDELLTEKDNELQELLKDEDKVNKTIVQDKTSKEFPKEVGYSKVVSEL